MVVAYGLKKKNDLPARLKMNIVWGFCLLVVPFTVVSGSEILTETYVEVVRSLADYFKVSFCTLVQDQDRKDLMLNKFHPSKRELLTNWQTFSEISYFLNSSLTRNGKTMVVFEITSETIASLSQLSASSTLSPVIWIAFSEHELQKEALQDVYIPFDCEFIYVMETDSTFTITELYQIRRNYALETYNLGFWTREDGLFITEKNFYLRRNNLKGCKLKGLINNNPPYVSIGSNETGASKFGGFLFEIWNELEFRINFSTEFPDIHFDKSPEEIFNNGDVDFAVARIAMEPTVLDFMDISQPIDEARFYMFGHRPGSELDWDSYLKPFSPNTWFVNLGWMLTSSLALTVLYKIAWNFGTSEREANYFIFTFSESLLTVFRAICMQGSDVTPRSSSCRLLFLSIYVTALVVTSAFSAALFSLLTIPKPRSPFNSLDEVLNNWRYKIGLPADPNFRRMIEDFAGTLPPSKQLKLLEKLLSSTEYLPLTPEEGLERLCRDKMYVFMFDLPNVLYLMQNMTRTCQDKILPSGPPLFTEPIGFGFRKQSPYKNLINFHLIRMRNEGILKRLLLNYWPPKIPTVQATWVRVTLSDISPILYMFALGTIIGMILLYVEKLTLQVRKKHRNYVNSSKLKNRVLLNQQIILTKYSKHRNLSNWEWYIKRNDNLITQ